MIRIICFGCVINRVYPSVLGALLRWVGAMSHLELHVLYVINMLHNDHLITIIHNLIYCTRITQPTHEMKHEQ